MQESGWKVYTMEDAYKERPPIKFAVGGMIATPSLNIFYGAPGTYKSMLLADMMLCVAQGKCWPTYSKKDGECYSRDTQKMPTLWVDFDNGKRTTLDRFQALGNFYKTPKNADVKLVTMPSGGLNMIDAKSFDNLQSVMPRNGLVVIDNLALVLGDVHENDPKMATVMGNFRWLSEEYQSAIIVIHHQRKTSGETTRVGESLRGHSSIEASLDLAMLITAKPDENSASLMPTKIRNLKYIEPFNMEFHDDYQGGKAFFHFEAVPSSEAEVMMQKAIVEFLNKKGKANQTEIMKAVSKSKKAWKETTVRRVVLGMEEKGLLGFEKGEHGQKLYGVLVPNDLRDWNTIRKIQELIENGKKD